MIHPKLNLQQGEKCSLDPNSYIGYKENGKGKLTLLDNVRIGHNTIIRTCGGQIIIGENVVINYGCIMHGLGGIQIHKNTLLSPNVQLYAQNHGIKKNELIRDQKQTGKGIIIGEDCWIGANSIILDGVILREGVIIGAGSVVKNNILPYEIWAGNPAKKIGERK